MIGAIPGVTVLDAELAVPVPALVDAVTLIL